MHETTTVTSTTWTCDRCYAKAKMNHLPVGWSRWTFEAAAVDYLGNRWGNAEKGIDLCVECTKEVSAVFNAKPGERDD